MKRFLVQDKIGQAIVIEASTPLDAAQRLANLIYPNKPNIEFPKPNLTVSIPNCFMIFTGHRWLALHAEEILK